jgi:hypothetical protein
MNPQDTTPAGADLFPFQALRASLMILAAMIIFPIAGGFVAAAAPRLVVLQHRSMLALAATHLVALGWGTLVAMGALHQMLPAAVGVRRDLSPLIPAQLAVHAAGVAALVAGFVAGSHLLLIAGGAAITLSIAVLVAVMADVLRRRRRALPVLPYVAAAVVCLAGAAAWGLLIAINWKITFWPALLRAPGLGVHLSLGLIGWFALLIVGVSYYLLPRFAGLREAPGRPGLIFALLGGGLLALITGASVRPTLVRAGLLLIGVGGLIYAGDLLVLIRAWRTRALDITRAHWWVLTGETAALGIGSLAWALGLLPGEGLRWAIAGVSLFLLGWTTLAITGQVYKVTPFLMWYYRFHLGMSAYEIPRLEAPYWPRAGLPSFGLLAVAAPLVALGVLCRSPALATAGGLAYSAGSALFSLMLGYSWLPVLWTGRRPSRPAEPR